MADQTTEDDDAIKLDSKGQPEAVPAGPETPEEVETPEPEKPDQPPGESKWSRFKSWYKANNKLSVPLSIIVLLVLLLIIPQTRYAVAGTVYKKNYTISVTDSVTNTPISGATISSGSISAQTGGDGRATLHMSVGKHNLSISKTYYDSQNLSVTVALLSQKTTPGVSFVANGRQVKITVTNTFTHQPLANADIKFADTDTKTDATGNALGIVPESTKSAKATLSLDGYNSANVNVQASDSQIEQNSFTLTPTGKIYFLSKLSGNIDVVKTDLDGKNRKTVLAGTGDEQDSNTVLLASRDWKYLALLSKRDNSNPKLYLIDTSNDKVTTIDQGKATFTPVGWDEHYFVYQVDRSGILDWQSGASTLKSFNADSGQIIPMDSTAGMGTGNSKFARENYDYYYQGNNNFYIINHRLIYSKSWSWSYSNDSLVKNQSNTINSIGVDGSSPQTLLSYSYSDFLNSFLNDPQTIYYQLQASKEKYYTFKNGAVQLDSSIKNAYLKYQDTYDTHTYLLSPNGQSVFWYDPRDGKNSLLLGEAGSAQNSTTIWRSADYTPYGWYTNDYVLISKNSSELYILPKSGVKGDIKPYKITDYHKPDHNFYGYGGGYGGI